MSKITVLDRTSLKVLRNKIDEALSLIEDDLGVSIKTGHISYQEYNCTVKLECSVQQNEKGEKPLSKEEKSFQDYAHYFDLNPDTKKEYNHPRLGKVRFTGYKSRASKYPFIITTFHGDSYKLSEEQAKKLQDVV